VSTSTYLQPISCRVRRLAHVATHSTATAALIFAMLATISFLFFRDPPILSDQLDYFRSAWALPDVEPAHRQLRVGLIWPVWFLTKIFGYSEFSYYGIPLLTRFLLGFATWWLGKHMFSTRVGWTAGLLLMFTPAYTEAASQLLPDYFAAALVALSLALIFRAMSDSPTPARSQISQLFLSGLVIGWAYLSREYVVILFPCIGLALLLLRTTAKGWLAFCLGALIIYSLELLWGLLVYGDPLVRFASTSSPRQTSWEFATELSDILTLLPTVFSRYGGWQIPAFVVFGLAAPLFMLYERSTSWRLLAVWSVLGWIFFTSIALLPVLLLNNEAVYLRLHKFRYWAIIFPPIFIGGVAAIYSIHAFLTARTPRWFAHIVATALLAVPVSGTMIGLTKVSDAKAFVRSTGGEYEEFRKFLSSHPSMPDVLWMDHIGGVASSNSLPIYFNSPAGIKQFWSGEVRYLNNTPRDWISEDEIRDGYVALDRTRASRRFRLGPPDYFVAPESVWRTIFRSSKGNILVLDPSLPPLSGRPDVIIPPQTLEVRAIGKRQGEYSTNVGARSLHVYVTDNIRVAVSDGIAPGIAAPPDGVNEVPAGTRELIGRLRLARLEGREEPAVRCLFYDAEGNRTAPWAVVTGGMPHGTGEGQFTFSCPVPENSQSAASARVMMQLTGPVRAEIVSLDYSFVK